ncbi:MAG: 3-phosphoshikimate 1-carboxyvinyltransferase [Alkalibacterium sp.]|nr:3-phosphoshikimate 1-carboxyvinyltransferase [Alkalibacterium sp.]
MTHLEIRPNRLEGNVTVPPSKSLAHRAIICAALAQGESTVRNIQFSDDIRATIDGMRSFGAEITEKKDNLIIQGIGINAEKSRKSSMQSERTETVRLVDCNESGSTLRFLVPVATLFDGRTRFTGRGKLGKRPLTPYEELFNQQGLDYEVLDTEKLDLLIKGTLSPDTIKLRGDISSQFITGLLMTLPFLDGDSQIKVTTPLESKGYIDLTLAVFEEFGLNIQVEDNGQTFIISGQQSLQAADYTVEGDYSQAAFFLSANQLGNDLELSGLNEQSLQGDKAILMILDKLATESDRTIDGSQFPDIIPIAALAAALTKGHTRFENLERLRIKESDRLLATQAELEALGADIHIDGDALVINGVDYLKGGVTVWSHKDHRIAMMLGIASTKCDEPIIIQDTDCVAKSYPNFWEVFQTLGGHINERHLG